MGTSTFNYIKIYWILSKKVTFWPYFNNDHNWPLDDLWLKFHEHLNCTFTQISLHSSYLNIYSTIYMQKYLYHIADNF